MAERVLMGGVSYYPDHWPRAEWERDMRMIKESGLDLIRFGEFSWHWFEPQDGVFAFEQCDDFMDLAHRLGLQVMLCTPTAVPPRWLLCRYPDMFMVDQYGRKNPLGRHMANFHHPQFRIHAKRVIQALANRYQDHPALFGWQIDNEPTFGESADRERLYDYSTYTVERFRAYLKAKYIDIDKLNQWWQNQFWSATYNDWEEIGPPIIPGNPGNPSLWLEWMRFRDRSVADFVKWQASLLRSVDERFFIGTNIPECGFSTAALAQDYWAQAEGLDFVGTDLYYFGLDDHELVKRTAFSCDIIRSAAQAAGAEFWISETQGGPHRGFRATAAVLDAKFQERVTCAYAKNGAKAVLYFLWRPTFGGAEFGDNGVVNLDGSPTEISQSLPSILEKARLASREPDMRPVAYIHYSRDSILLAAGYTPDDASWQALQNWHHDLQKLGYRVDFLSDEQLIGKKWEAGEICVLPYTTVMSRTMRDFLRRHAENGVQWILGEDAGKFTEFGTMAFGTDVL